MSKNLKKYIFGKHVSDLLKAVLTGIFIVYIFCNWNDITKIFGIERRVAVSASAVAADKNAVAAMANTVEQMRDQIEEIHLKSSLVYRISATAIGLDQYVCATQAGNLIDSNGLDALRRLLKDNGCLTPEIKGLINQLDNLRQRKTFLEADKTMRIP